MGSGLVMSPDSSYEFKPDMHFALLPGCHGPVKSIRRRGASVLKRAKD
jgi:hypothetical protein